MQEIKLLQIIKEEVTRRRHPEARRNPTFYPSSAAALLEDGEVIGGCWRSDWYRLHNITPTDDSSFYMHMIWHLGNSVESKVIDAMKCGGVYENSGVKFYNKALNVSGELDVVGRYRLNGQIRYYGVEVKSVYGIGATKTITGRARAWRGQPAFDPYPKESNLMQVMTYIPEFSGEEDGKYTLDFFKLIYLPRDKPNDGREFTITLVTKDDLDSELLGKYGMEMKDGERYAKVETEGFDPKIETRWSVEDLYLRWNQQQEYLAQNVPPPRPFKKFYDEDEIERLYDLGYISKTAYTDWEKAGKPAADIEKTPGHFLCQSYCDYRSFCYTRNGKPRVESDRVGLVSITDPKE